MTSQALEQCQIGWALLNTEKYVEAIRVFEVAVSADHHLSSYEGLGLALFRELKARDRAFEAERRAGELSQKDILEMGKQAIPVPIRISHATLDEIAQMMDRSRVALMRAYELGTEKADVWMALVRTPGIPCQVRDICLERTLQKNPRNGAANFLQGMRHVRAKEYDQARVQLQRAIEAEPDNAYWRCEMGSCCLNLDRNEEALAELSTAVRLDPKFASSWYNLGTSFYRLGRRESAVHAFKTFLSIEPYSSDAPMLRELLPELVSP